MNIRPRNYDEVMRLKRCLLLQRYVPEIDDELLEQIFYFLARGGDNRVRAAENILTFTDENGQVIFTKALEHFDTARYTSIDLTPLTFFISHPYTSSYGGSGGSSGNNNNNNNNNNNG